MKISSSITKIVFLLLLVLAVGHVEAQTMLPCDAAKIDTAALRKAMQFETTSKKNGRVQAPRFLIRIFFHIGTDDDGSNAPINIQTIRKEFDTLRADYAGTGICFSFAGYDYMNSTKLNNNFNKNTDNAALFDGYRQTSCINVFYLQRINGNNPACVGCGIGGTSLSIPSTICLISKGNIGPGRTISHEVGHCMGLLHTFETARGVENIDGGNASGAGDLITDTPADPFSFNGNACFIVSGCTYQGYCADPNGDKNYIPPYTNLMSYWVNTVSSRSCIPTLHLTLGQYNRVYSFLSTDEFLLTCGTGYFDYIITPVSKNRGSFFWTATNSISTSGVVDLSETLKAAIGAQTIRLHPGFHAKVTTGRIIISSTVCK